MTTLVVPPARSMAKRSRRRMLRLVALATVAPGIRAMARDLLVRDGAGSYWTAEAAQ